MTAGVLISQAAGVRVGLGSDLIGPHQGHRGAELLVRSALQSPMAALVSATSTNAEILGIAERVGTIEPGKQADLVGFAGNPLDEPNLFADRAAVTFAIQNGRIVKDTR